MESLVIKNLNFQFNERKIFNELNLILFPKRIYAISAPSGKGKSTLAKVIAGHLPYTEGEVSIDGNIINKPGREVFIVHQEDDLFPWMTVIDQLNFVKNKVKSNADLIQLLKIFKLDQFENYYPYQLSGGMKKRLALLRAEIVSPKVLILDESLSSLDVELIDSILSEMVPIWKNRSMVVILITHQLNQVKNFVDEVISL
jgi:NitT/TauT family transport system ATP-binding protein